MNKNFGLAKILSASLLLVSSLSFGQEAPVYSQLKEINRIEITANFEVLQSRTLEMTILSQEGLDHAKTVLFYDRLNEVLDFDILVTDPENGKTLQKGKLKDMQDFAQYSTMSIFDDNRYKLYSLKSAQFPIRVVINTKTKSKTNFFLPTWVPVHHYNQKVLASTLEVRYPKELGLRYDARNLLGEKTEKIESEYVTITWDEKDLHVQERDMEDEDDHRLFLAPGKFALGDFEGQMSDWDGLAKWQYDLNLGRNVLPEEFQKKALDLVSGIDDPYEKIKVLYSYLQNNYRYVSIQLGIGGWQTMTATETVKYAYGDCKGLTNLMQGMLAAVGVPSNYTLVRAGADEDDIEIDFPSNQFNHVILQVPLSEQMVWLECTSNLHPAGYLGDFTSNRHALVITPTGGYLTKTPAYSSPAWNTIQTNSKLWVKPDGNAELSTSQLSRGNPAEALLRLKKQADTREQRDYFSKNSSISGLILEQLEFDVTSEDSILLAQVNYSGIIQKFVQNTAKRMILKPIFNQLNDQMLSNNGMHLREEITLVLEGEIQEENPLENINLEEENLTLSLTHQREGKNIKVTREIEIALTGEESEDTKRELVKRLNSLSNKPYYFKKSLLSTQNE